jgi:hypothetical protein
MGALDRDYQGLRIALYTVSQAISGLRLSLLQLEMVHWSWLCRWIDFLWRAMCPYKVFNVLLSYLLSRLPID